MKLCVFKQSSKSTARYSVTRVIGCVLDGGDVYTQTTKMLQVCSGETE